MSCALSWDQFWPLFKQSSNEVKRNLWKQMDLMNFLPRLSIDDRQEVMKNAPDDILRYGPIRILMRIK